MVRLRLSPRQREILTLKCRDGLTHKEVGARLGVSGQTVKNHLTVATSVNDLTSPEICWYLSREDLFDDLARRAVPDEEALAS